MAFFSFFSRWGAKVDLGVWGGYPCALVIQNGGQAMHFEFFLCIAYVSVLLPWLLPSLFALCVLLCFCPVLLSAAGATKGGQRMQLYIGWLGGLSGDGVWCICICS